MAMALVVFGAIECPPKVPPFKLRYGSSVVEPDQRENIPGMKSIPVTSHVQFSHGDNGILNKTRDEIVNKTFTLLLSF